MMQCSGMVEAPSTYSTQTLLSKADSASLCWVHMCMCVHVAVVITPSLPLSLSLFTSTSAVPLLLISPVPARETHACLSSAWTAGSAPASLCPSRVPSSLQPMSPPVGLTDQPAAGTSGAAELSDAALPRRYASALLSLSAFRPALSFSG